MRLFTGDVERGCSGTTPGRKLKEHRFVAFIRDPPSGSVWSHVLQARLASSLFIDVERLHQQQICIKYQKLMHFDSGHCGQGGQTWNAFVLPLSCDAQRSRRTQKYPTSSLHVWAPRTLDDLAQCVETN